MKKFNFLILLLSVIHISGCSKNFNQVADDKPSLESSISQTVFTTKNSEDITKDYTAIKAVPALAELENMDSHYKIIEAVNNKDYKKADLLLKQMKDVTQKYNQQLDNLNIRSSEVNTLRDLLKDFNQNAIKVLELRLQKNIDENQAKYVQQQMEEVMLKLDKQVQLIEKNISQKK